MNKKTKIFLLVLTVIVVVSATTILSDEDRENYKPGSSSTYDSIIAAALKLYQKQEILGMDFSEGPCLTNDLAPDWVVDLVHNPRQPVDDLSENQCAAFREGRARHFVELDLRGNVVRIY